MNTKFEFTKKINSNKNLNSLDKTILNEIISFVQSGKLFYASDKALAEEWGKSVPTIQRTISTLKHFGLICSDVERKPHIQDGVSWYNKRYITVNYDALQKFLETEGVLEKPKKNKIPRLEEKQTQRITIETKEPIIFDYPENEGGDLYPDELFYGHVSIDNSTTTEEPVIEMEKEEGDKLNVDQMKSKIKSITPSSDIYKKNSSLILYVLEEFDKLDTNGVEYFYNKIFEAAKKESEVAA